MHRRERELTATYRFLRALGPAGLARLIAEIWPVWDAIIAGIAYRDGKPIFATSVAADALGLRSRTDTGRLPPVGRIIAYTRPYFDEDTQPQRYRFGRYEVVYLAELEYPVPVPPVTSAETNLYPETILDGIQAVWAAGSCAETCDTRWLLVSDEGEVIHTAFELSEALGYPPRDHQWVPEAWLGGPVETGFNYRFDQVFTGDGVLATLRTYTIRVEGHSLYLPRLWFGPESDRVALHVDVTLAEGFDAPDAPIRDWFWRRSWAKLDVRDGQAPRGRLPVRLRRAGRRSGSGASSRRGPA